ncbi:MAG: JAB domain-containing protein [Bacillota bacterium]
MRAKKVDIITLKVVRESSLLYKPRKIQGPEDAFELIRSFLEDADREMFTVIYLNTKNEPTAIHTVSVGTLNSSLVHPREVFKAAVLVNAASLILAHNHPSNDVQPSREDIEITRKLVDAGNILGVQVLDHIVVGSGRFRSMKNAGIL